MENKVIFVDIDGTICNSEYPHYDKAEPIKERIEAVNKLHDNGHTVVYWTARGTNEKDVVKRVNIFTLTKIQLEKWGCKYTELRFKKPVWDLYIGDRVANEQILDNIESLSCLLGE